ncbi:helix-turn-helix domain-containing protein [Chryseobacterium sp. ISL-6]|uniref:helix-turn-helix domain-containing protein n=1 Tax=Chryseobacterium sp. ISL-6 TaxID=2819143 RepID=UPI001BE4E305|nr:helix-turn-helix domain-containing protein [Chryseobacterium sp. ISL-6]MBT2621261.1 AraC family transcriptional regulator [Chryseobacterium sp. ISL-6]
MHIYQLTIIDKKLKEAIAKFSLLPINTSIFDAGLFEQLLHDSRVLIKTYISLLKLLQILPEQNQYYKGHFLIKHTATGVEADGEIHPDYLTAIQNLVLPHLLSRTSDRKQILPIHIHFTTSKEVYLFSGISLLKQDESTMYSLLHEMSMPINHISYTSHSRCNYLLSIIYAIEYNERQSIHNLYPIYNISYRQFRKDCKICLGTTFHNFYIKMKMLDVLNDIMLTNLSLKEIAHKNNFSSYIAMYQLFKRKYNFPLNIIPRILIGSN